MAAEPWLTWTSALSIVSSIATIIAIPYAAYQVHLARVAASAAATVAILDRVTTKIMALPGEEEEAVYKVSVANLLNELEFACSLFFDGQLKGHTGKLARQFIADILGHIDANIAIKTTVVSLVHSPDTFECIQKFARKHKKDWAGLRR